MSIEQAIQAEQKYLEERGNILDYLAPCGYTNLDDYFRDKREYLVANIEYDLYEGTIEDIIDTIGTYIEKNKYAILMPTTNRLFVWTGEGDLNKDYCCEHNIEIINLGYVGGTIVTGPQDFSLMITFPNNIDVDTRYILEKFYDFFSERLDNVVIDHNDILVNNKKVLGAMQIYHEHLFVFACEISFSDHADEISHICTKRSEKDPGYISEFTRETMVRMVKEWLQ